MKWYATTFVPFLRGENWEKYHYKLRNYFLSQVIVLNTFRLFDHTKILNYLAL